jgi:hypothetical protein
LLFSEHFFEKSILCFTKAKKHVSKNAKQEKKSSNKVSKDYHLPVMVLSVSDNGIIGK